MLGSIPLAFLSLLTIRVASFHHFVSFLITIPHTIAIVLPELKHGTHPGSMPNLYGLTYLLSGHKSGPLISLILSILLIIWAARQPASFPLAILVAMLVSNHLYVHDLSPAILPLALLLERLLALPRPSSEHPRSAQNSRLIACWISLSILLAAPVMLLMMGHGKLPLVAIPLLILTLMFPGFWPSVSAELLRLQSSHQYVVGV